MQLAVVSVSLFCLTLFYFIGISLEAYSLINKIGPIVLGIVCFWGSYSIVRNVPLMFWSPLPWFLLASGVFFGLGPLVYHYATPETVAFVNSLWMVSPLELAESNALNSGSIGIIIATVLVAGKMFGYQSSDTLQLPNHIPPASNHHSAMWFFLVVGLIVKYFFALPYTLGLTGFVLPGFILHMDKFVLAALVILVVLVKRGEDKYRLILYLVLGSELLTAVMTFSKMAVILVVFAMMFGLYLSQVSLKKMIIMGLITSLLYALVLSPFVTYARIYFRAGGAVDLSQLMNATDSYSNSRNEISNLLPGVQSWWSRLSYTNAQGFVMHQYQNDTLGDSLNSIFWVLVPRMLYPDKPVFADARELTRMIQGPDAANNITSGVFAEAYWNGGVPFLILICFYIGCIYFLLGRFAVWAVKNQKYEYMPLLMSGIGLGYSVDAWFVPAFVGSIIEWIVLYFIITLIFTNKQDRVLPMVESKET